MRPLNYVPSPLMVRIYNLHTLDNYADLVEQRNCRVSCHKRMALVGSLPYITCTASTISLATGISQLLFLSSLVPPCQYMHIYIYIPSIPIFIDQKMGSLSLSSYNVRLFNNTMNLLKQHNEVAHILLHAANQPFAVNDLSENGPKSISFIIVIILF